MDSRNQKPFRLSPLATACAAALLAAGCWGGGSGNGNGNVDDELSAE